MNFKRKLKSIITITFVLIIIVATNVIAMGANSISKLQNSISFDNDELTKDNSVQGSDISLDVYNGGVNILPTSSAEIEAEYDSQYYDVQIKNDNSKWTISISGKVAKMGETDWVKLYIPDTGCNIDIDVLCGSLAYNLPQNCLDLLNITAKDSSIEFASKNNYNNSSISITATDKDYIKYSYINGVDYFTVKDNKFEYKNDKAANQINILLTGYTNINFNKED